jgi:hypothetical protein
MDGFDIKRAIDPLRLIFWGGIICVLDFKINGFDILNDVVGTIMIAWGVFRLGGMSVHEHYSRTMMFVKVVAAVCIFEAVSGHFRYQVNDFVSLLTHLFGMAKVLATVVFCIAMRWLCQAGGLTRSRESWKMTAILFGVIYLVPWGVFHIAGLLATITRRPFHFNLGPIVLLLLVVFVVPLVHLFMSTSRMKREAESIPAGVDEPERYGEFQ